MEFMIMIHSDENRPTPGPGEPGFEEFMGTGWPTTRSSSKADTG